ncbi:MAG: BRCT domain-containing protein [candidate division KSB1 bacterium]|nr:BRCT domain-containing protein [candidate division KSB1 bacterium]
MSGNMWRVRLVKEFKSMRKLSKASKDELMDIHEIGPQVAESVVDFFNADQNLRTVERLKSAGIPMQIKESETQENRLKGCTIVFTGSLETLSRKQAKETTERLGGRATGSVSSNTDYVVVGENPGFKSDKAKELGVTIISEQEFRDMAGLESNG